jgi:hypothetical protein
VYRDAYLRGDLAMASVLAVERYLQRDATAAHATVVRWHELGATETMPKTSWLSKQLRFILRQPQRLRRRIATFGLASATLAWRWPPTTGPRPQSRRQVTYCQ